VTAADFESGGEHRATPQLDLQGADPDWLSDTIGSIYDSVLQPDGWPAVVGAICQRFSFASGVLGIVQLRPGAHEITVHHGVDEEWIGYGDAYIHDSLALWGGPARIQAFPVGEPILNSDVMPRKEMIENRYSREVLLPRGLFDGIAVTLAREAELMAYFGLNRHVSAGEIPPGTLASLRLLTPHLRRAVTISNLFDLKAVEGKTFGSVLESMSCAVVLVDEDLGLVHANRAAAAMLDEGQLIRSAQGKLSLGGRLAEDALRSAVQLAAKDEALIGQRGIGIRARGMDGAPAVLHVLPLRRGELRAGLAQRAVAAVFVASADQGANAPVDAISVLYDFTPTEGQIFAALSKGRTLAKAAEALGIAKSTARTHLLRIFDKTGCKRQAELVALAAKLSLAL
jgi:DNA-binding CsgD family transcriptional regulator